MKKKYYNTTSKFVKTVVTAFTVCIYLESGAQPVQFNAHRITTESGLYTSDIRHLLQDRNGFMWIATSNRIQRYDGKYTRDFFIKDGNTYFRGIAESHNGKIWVATNNNLFVFKDSHVGFMKFADTKKKAGDYLTMINGPAGKVYILCRKGILQLNETTDTFKTLPIQRFQIPNTSYFPFLSYKNFLFWSTRTMIYKYDTGTSLLDSVPASFTRNIEIINEDSIWAGSTKLTSSLISFKTKNSLPITARQFDKKFNSPDFYVVGAIRISPQYMFVPIRLKGFFLYNLATHHFAEASVFSGGSKLKFDEAPKTGLYTSPDGKNWLNLAGGLYYLIRDDGVFAHLNISGSENEIINESSNSARNFAETGEGTIWIATGNGLAKWNRFTNETKIYLPKIGSDNYLNFASVRGIVANGDRLIIAESQGGVFLFDPQKETFNQLTYPLGAYGDSVKKWLFSDFISGLFTLRNGDFITASNKRTFYISKNDNSVRPVVFKGQKSIPYTRIIFEDTKRRLWFLGGPGLTVTDSSFNILHKITNAGLNGIYINSITQVTDTTYWVAWEGLHEVTLSNGVPQLKSIFTDINKQVFYNIFKDSLGYCWASSEKGIYKLFPDKKSYRLFDQSENVLNQQFSSALAFRSKDGNVFFPGFNGVTYFYPEKFYGKDDTLHTVITNVKINENDSLFFSANGGDLSYNQNSIEINYIAPYVYNGNKVQYRYFLEGADKDWVNTGNNTFVRFTALSPGRFEFRAAASLNRKDWYETTSHLVFTILPPFWQTWWFRLLSILFLSALVYGLFQRRIKTIKESASIKQQMTELEVKALRAQMNPHFIFNAMNTIQQFTLKNDIDNANIYISKFSLLLRKVLHSSKQVTSTLEEEIKLLFLYADIEKARMGEEFIFEVSVEEQIETDAVRIPGMLIQPFVENAVKHGLALKEGQKKIVIAFQLRDENCLQVTVTDNGIGRKQAATIKKEQQKMLPYESKGIQMVEERLSFLAKTKKTKKSVSFEDLYSDNSLPAGTRVIIQVPLNTGQ